ncbi:MAG: putative signal peptide peptidase SppA [Verrucomicrobia subdivision 3 bacterium]|nr:putative signal peptide peptidase SppA [Limisphaerales bacterium]MCS1412749.1 putative signal peptide peptidase SppA [Limisphaerales bacterium]
MESDQPANPYRIRRNPGGIAHYPPPPLRGRGWFFLCLILAALLGLTWLGILGAAGTGLALTGGTSGYWEEAVIKNNQSTNRVVIVEVDGLISNLAIDPSGKTMVDSIEDQLDLAAEDDSVIGVILRVDSPGGEVLASDDIYREIKQFQEKTGKPVLASMSGLAASGGYYIAASCRWIVANELTITGSIGVILHSYNYRGLMDKVGVFPQVFKSGRYKDMLRGDKAPGEIEPGTNEMVQGMINEIFDRFKKVVSEGRSGAQSENNGEGKALVEDWESYADGRILSGKQAFNLGFVDELGNFDTATARMAQLTKTEDFNLIQYQLPFTFANLFRAFGEANPKRIEIDLGLRIPPLQAGRLYFLAPNYLN